MHLFKLEFPADICPGAELLDHIELLLLVFKDSPYYFPSGYTNLHSRLWAS